MEWLKAYFLRHCDRFVVPGKASFEYLRLAWVLRQQAFDRAQRCRQRVVCDAGGEHQVPSH